MRDLVDKGLDLTKTVGEDEDSKENENLTEEDHFEDGTTVLSKRRRSTLKPSIHKRRASSVVSKTSSNEVR